MSRLNAMRSRRALRRVSTGLTRLSFTLVLLFSVMPVFAFSLSPASLDASLTPGGIVNQQFRVQLDPSDSVSSWELLPSSGAGSLTPTPAADSRIADYSFSDPGDLRHCETRNATVTANGDSCFGDGCDISDLAKISVTYQDPLTISETTISLSGSPGATLQFSTAFSGGVAPVSAASPTSLGASVTVSGSRVTYTYQIPFSTPAGTINDTVTINGATTSCGGDSAQIAVTINVLPGPSIDPDSLMLSGGPGATVSGSLAVSGGTAGYSWNADSGSVDPMAGSSVTYSYQIPDNAAEGRLEDRVTVTDANEATDTVEVLINVTNIPPPPGLVVKPGSLTLIGAAGTEVSSDELQVTGGSGNFMPSAEKGTAANTSGGVILYNYNIPPRSTGTIRDTVTVRDTDPAVEPVTVPVTIEVLPPIAVSPSPLELSALSLVGVEGEASASFDVSGGTPPYFLSVASGGSGTVEPARLDTAGSATYAVAVPASSAAVVISDLISITDSGGNSVEAPVAVNVAASDSLSSRDDLTPNERSVARAIETLCPQLGMMSSRTAEQEDLFQQCSEMLGNSTSSGIPNTLEQVTTEKARAATSAAIETGNQQLANIGSRLAAVRGGATGLSLQGFTLNVDGQPVPAQLAADMLSSQLSGGAASGDSPFGRWGFFLNGSFNFGDKDATENESGFDFSTTGVTAGADYRFSDQLVAGGALGYATNDTTFDSQGGGLDTETWHLAAYGTYGWSERGYVDAIVEYGCQGYDSKRNIRYQVASDTSAVNRQARADYDGTQFGASIGAGYDFDQGPLSYGVYGRAGYLQVDVDDYREHGAGGLALSLDGFSATSVTTTLGARVSQVLNTNWAVLVPQARAEWEHEYDNDADTLVARFAADPTGTAFGILSDSPDRDYFRLGLGVSAVFPHGLSAFVNYDTVLDQQDWSNHLIDVGVRWEFE